MELEYLLAFLLLVYEVPLSLKKLPNGYCGDHEGSNCEICKRRPWWLIETNVGMIKVGWRKRVIVLDWEATGIPLGLDQVNVHDVTKSEYMVHCCGYDDLITRWNVMLHRLRCVVRDRKRAEEEAVKA